MSNKNDYEEWLKLAVSEIKDGHCPYCEQFNCTEKINEKTYKCTECGKDIVI